MFWFLWPGLWVSSTKRHVVHSKWPDKVDFQSWNAEHAFWKGPKFTKGKASGENSGPVNQISSVQSVIVSNSSRPNGLQHARPPCPSPTPIVYSNSCPLSRWYHPTISYSVIPFSLFLLSFPASGSFPMSHLFASSSQSIGASVLASVLPMNILCWFPQCLYMQPKWTCKLSPDVMVVGVAGLWEAIRSQGQSPSELYYHYYKKTSEIYLLCSAL